MSADSGQPPLLVGLNVDRLRCLVVGGGQGAAQRGRLLLERGAEVTVVAPQLEPQVRQLSGAVTILERDPKPADLAGMRLVFTTDPRPRVQTMVFDAARRHGALVNTADVPALCDFIAPALVRRGSLQLAVSTAGESPFLAASLRDRLERDFGAEWGELTGLMGWVRRRLRAAETPPARQQAVFRRLLRPDLRRALKQGTYSDAAAIAQQAAATPEPPVGSVHLVGAGPGDASLLTLAARDLLAAADVVFHDALVHPTVLQLCNRDARLVDVGKRAQRASAQQQDIVDAMLEAARSGSCVVRLKGGDPLLFARAAEELNALASHGIQCTIVAGVTSVTAAAAAAGVPLTERGVSSSLAVITAHDRDGALSADIEKAAAAVETLAVLMPLRHLAGVCERIASVTGAQHPAALVVAAATEEQRVIHGTLAELAEHHQLDTHAPAVLLTGQVLRRTRSLPLAVAAR